MGIRTTVLFSAVIIDFLVIIGFFALRLIQPLRDLSLAVQRVGRGDLYFEVNVDSNDEIGQLAESFNQMTEDLKESTVSKDDMENIIRSMNETLVVLSPEGTIQPVNPATCDRLGYQFDELIGQSFEKILGGEAQDDETLRPGIQKLDFISSIQSDFDRKIERRYLAKNGDKVPVIFSASPLRDSVGIVEGIVCVALDISLRKQAEEALSAEKERLAVTLRSINDGVITTDIEGKITLINKVAEALTGWSQVEAIGKPLCKIFHIINLFTRVPCENPVYKVIAGGTIVGLANHTVLVSKDGTERVIADSGAPNMNRESRIIGVVLVFRDITDKQKMEAKLLKVQKLESLGVLAGGIAHDLNNFLTAIIGNLSLAKLDSKPGDQVIARLDEMEKASLQTKDLTQQLLTFSKGGEPIKWVSLPEFLKNSSTFSLRGSNGGCHFSIAEDLLSVEVDEGQMGQVINNLVLNADHAMPEGGVIEIRAENATPTIDNAFSLPAGTYVKLSFLDNGVGIQPDHLSKIFDPYFTTKHRGSGLGLTVAFSIVDKHNGRLSEVSELGRGTTFTIFLPASAKSSFPRDEQDKQLHKGKGKILVMDDKEFIRNLAEQM